MKNRQLEVPHIVHYIRLCYILYIYSLENIVKMDVENVYMSRFLVVSGLAAGLWCALEPWKELSIYNSQVMLVLGIFLNNTIFTGWTSYLVARNILHILLNLIITWISNPNPPCKMQYRIQRWPNSICPIADDRAFRESCNNNVKGIRHYTIQDAIRVGSREC